jgi:hypothetical protein
VRGSFLVLLERMEKKYPLLGAFCPISCAKDKGRIFTRPEVDKYIIEYYLIY